MLREKMRQSTHEVKNTGVFPLMLSEGFIIHEKIDGMSVSVVSVDPVGVRFSRKGIAFPSAITEPKRQIIGKRVVLQQQLDTVTPYRVIYIIRTSPSQHRIPAFSHNTEIPVVFTPFGKIV